MYEVQLETSYFPAVNDTPFEMMTIGDLLRRAASQWPQETALREVDVDGDVQRTWTYEQLLADSLDLGQVLAARHQKGARVAVWAPNIPEWVLLEYALAFAGVTLVTVNPSYQTRELSYVLEQSRAEALYYVGEFRGNPMEKIASEACAKSPLIRHRIDMTDRDALWGGPKAALPLVAADDPAQIQYTSGTTGFPKGAVLHHQGLVQNGRDTIARQALSARPRSLNYMPLFHATGCAVHTLGMAAVGGNMALAPMFDPVAAIKFMARERVTLVVGVPTMLVALIETGRKIGLRFDHVEAVSSGGSMVSPELARAAQDYFGATIQIIYGQTESSPVITMVWPDDAPEDVTQTIGQPLPHVEVSIRDLSENKPTPIGEQGEICTRGYHVMTGYNDNEDATHAAIDDEGWLHTGDLGVMDARGFVKITGRVKEMIIRGGENLFPAEIENAILEHDAIAEAAVVGVPDEKWGEQVACFMRPRDPAIKLEDEALKEFIRQRISPQKTPAFWIWVDAWPLTGSGKIQKFKLAEAFIAGAYADATASGQTP